MVYESVFLGNILVDSVQTQVSSILGDLWLETYKYVIMDPKLNLISSLNSCLSLKA